MKNSRTQYPAQTGKYAVKVKHGSGWSAFRTARLQISVGQKYHEDWKFKATIEWARHRFDKVIICVNDTLQRYNALYSTTDEQTAFNRSEAAGREWIERNIGIIRQLPNFEIYRWEYWRRSQEFQAEHDYVRNLYATDPLVKDLVLQDIQIFWERRAAKERNLPDCSFDSFKKASIDYLLEETAAFFMMFKKDDAVDIYPGSVLLPCVLGQKYCPGGTVLNLKEKAFTRIDFLRNTTFEDQGASEAL